MLHKATLNTPVRKQKHQEGGWAVSYADFLMVLLSFFVVFFSTNRNSELYRIIADIDGKAVEVTSGGAGKPNKSIAEDGDMFAVILQDIPFAKLTTFHKKQRIEIELPNNIYPPGGYRVPGDTLNPILESLKKHEDMLIVTVVGHVDDTAFQSSKPVIRKSNLTLASVRSAYASIHIQEFLPKAEVRTQASNFNSRLTRSLTLMVEQREDES